MAARMRMRWGDAVDEEETGVPSLPPPSVTQHGNTKTVTEYYRNDKGDAVKKVTKYKVVSVEKKVYKVSMGSELFQRNRADTRSGKQPCSLQTA